MSTAPKLSLLARMFDNELFYRYVNSPMTVVATLIGVAMLVAAILAPWIAPQNPFDLAALDLWNSLLPPAWYEGGDMRFLLGTDDQGRDLLSALLYGTRTSLIVGGTSVLIAVIVGIAVGLIAGYVGGIFDAIAMRIVDIQMTFPAIMVALLIDGVSRGILPRDQHDNLAIFVIIFALSLSIWPQVARTVRASTMVQAKREYVLAAQVIGIPPLTIMFRHVLPNVLGPVLVIATINVGLAVLGEATLSFLGVGVPASQPSLGTLIRMGNGFLFSGEQWLVIFPGITLALLVLSVNLTGDWLRDVLDPKLR